MSGPRTKCDLIRLVVGPTAIAEGLLGANPLPSPSSSFPAAKLRNLVTLGSYFQVEHVS